MLGAGPWPLAFGVALVAVMAYSWAETRPDPDAPDIPIPDDPYGGPFGARLMEECNRLGMKFKPAASRFGMTQVDLILVRSGDRPPSLAQLKEMRAAGVDIRHLVLGPPEAAPPHEVDALQEAADWFARFGCKSDRDKMASALRELLQEP